MPATLTLTGTPSTAAFDENAIQATAQSLFPDVTFTADGNGDPVVFTGGALTISGLLADDIAAFSSLGGITVTGSDASFGGVSIGTISGGNGTDLTLTFSADATAPAIEALIESITFQSTSDAPTVDRTLTLNVTDTDAATTGGPTIAITITAEDDPFSATGFPTALAANEDETAVIDMSGFSITDPDATDPITVTLAAGNGTLSVSNAAKDARIAAVETDAAAAQAAAADAQTALDAAIADQTVAEQARLDANAIRIDLQQEASDAFVAYTDALDDFANMLITQVELDAALQLRIDTQLAVDAASVTLAAATTAENDAIDVTLAANADLIAATTAASDAQQAVTDAQNSLPSVTDNDTGTITIIGLPDDIGALLTAPDAVTYTGAADAFGADTVTATIDGAQAPLGTIAVTVAEQTDDRAATEAGDEGSDRFVGTDGADRMFGNGGADELSGGLGNDLLDGGAGVDSMQGGLGNDVYVVDDAGDLVREDETFANGGGVDTVFASIDYMLGDNTEILRLTGSATTATGNDAVNVLVGNELDNNLLGGGGNDRLVGNDGNDVLTGNSGSDILVGGFGVDTFVFTSIADSRAGEANRDLINGFVHGSEQVDLSTIDANTYNGAATNDEWTFIGSRAFDGTWGDSAGQLRTQSLGEGVNAVLVEGDHNGDGVADFQILMSGTDWMTGTDFVL